MLIIIITVILIIIIEYKIIIPLIIYLSKQEELNKLILLENDNLYYSNSLIKSNISYYIYKTTNINNFITNNDIYNLIDEIIFDLQNKNKNLILYKIKFSIYYINNRLFYPISSSFDYENYFYNNLDLKIINFKYEYLIIFIENKL